MSHITPVIGSISAADVSPEASNGQNVSSISENYSEEEMAEVSKSTVVTSHQKHKILKDMPNQEHCVGKVPITVIDQSSTSSEVEEENEPQIRPRMRSSRKSAVKDQKGIRHRDKMAELGMKRTRENGSKRSVRNSRYTKQWEEEGVNTERASCMKRQLKVIIPRLKMKDLFQTVLLKTLPNEHFTMSPKQPAIEDVSAVSKVDVETRKRKLSLAVTPEKNRSIDKQ